MITKELIERINYLAKKKREEGLTKEEEQEQAEVRRQYIEGIKAQLRPLLEECKPVNTKEAHPDGCSCEHKKGMY
ncbi:MAG: DUF896 domain-containing protein [Bacillota bacterium]|jgi:uncharacterized protein YnzC (UPF0291/DUF896 family)